jgi:hypothetical protein
MMGDTDLQLAKQKVSEQKQRVLRQQAEVLHLKGEGGKRLEVAVELWESTKDELTVMERRLDRLIFNA